MGNQASSNDENAAKSGRFPANNSGKTGPKKRKRQTVLQSSDLLFIDFKKPVLTSADCVRLRELIKTEDAVAKLFFLFGLKITRGP